MINDPLLKKQDAVDYLGSHAEVARQLGITRQAVCSWGANVPVLSAYRLIKKFPYIQFGKGKK
jgi:biotin operon repressor